MFDGRRVSDGTGMRWMYGSNDGVKAIWAGFECMCIDVYIMCVSPYMGQVRRCDGMFENVIYVRVYGSLGLYKAF